MWEVRLFLEWSPLTLTKDRTCHLQGSPELWKRCIKAVCLKGGFLELVVLKKSIYFSSLNQAGHCHF